MSILKSSFIFGFGTVLSRLFGLLRESAVAGAFGAGAILDAFMVANRIPNMLRDLVAEGALGSSFTKVFTHLVEEDEEEAQQLAWDAIIFFSWIMAIVCTLGIIYSSEITSSLTLLSDQESKQDFLRTTAGLTKILFPFIGFMTLGAIAQGILHEKGKFLVSSLAPIAFSIMTIVGALWFRQWFELEPMASLARPFGPPGIVGLSAGVLLGGFLQSAIQFAGSWKNFLSPSRAKIRLFPWSKHLKEVFVLMGPMVIAASAAQVNVFVNTNFATSLDEGAVSWLTFSFRLLQLPVGIIAVAIGTAALPSLARAVKNRSVLGSQSIADQLQLSVEMVMWLMGMCFVYILLNAQPLVDLLYRHGSFDAIAAHQTAESLYYYSFSLFGYGLIKVLTAFYYSADRTRYAMNVSIMSVGLNFLVNYYLVREYAHLGLAMGASMILTINSFLLVLGLAKEKLNFNYWEIARSAGLLLGALLFSFFFQRWVGQGHFLMVQSVKIRAALLLGVNMALVGAVFVGFVTLRMRASPLQKYKQFRRARNHRV